MKETTPGNLNEKDKEMLDSLLRETFDYFLKAVNKRTGLIADKTMPGSPSSIAAVGLGLSTYVIAVKRGLLSRQEAIKKTLNILRFFDKGKQGPEEDAMGYKGFYYHFIDMETGARVWDCELSTVDTGFFIAGALSAACFFTLDNEAEREIRDLADKLYRRVDWVWALDGRKTITHGWKPGTGFLPFRWDMEYNEALLLYVLAMGSPSFSIGEEGYREWTSTFKLKSAYGIEFIYAGPLFIHQLSHIWIDFRGIKDDYNRQTGIDYFENSKRATHVQRQYAIENKQEFAHYGENCWGFTASDGPGPESITVDGKLRVFYDYIARGAPYGPDDGTVSPWAVVSSLPFAPEIVIDTIRHAIEKLNLRSHEWHGFDASFNPTHPEKTRNPNGWISPWKFGLNEGPIILMIENFQTGFLWELMKNCPYIVEGLMKGGFKGGWLETHTKTKNKS